MLSYKQQRQREKLRRLRKKQGFHGYPVITVAFYGPNDQRASKVVASFVRREGDDIEIMKKWYCEADDARSNSRIKAEMLAFFAEKNAKSIVTTERIIGCPHEEGIDYPEGESCPECPFWKDRDRFTGNILH